MDDFVALPRPSLVLDPCEVGKLAKNAMAILGEQPNTPLLSNPTRKPAVNQRRANLHLQLVILRSVHQPCYNTTKINFHSHFFA